MNYTQQRQRPECLATFAYSVHISIPRNVKAELRIIGVELKREDLGRLKKQLLRLIESMEEAFND